MTIKTHRRKKRSRLRGSKTAFWGARKKHKDSGHRGGIGMAGTGKKSGHKKTLIQAKFPDYFGKTGFHSRKKRLEVLNLDDISRMLEKNEGGKGNKGRELDLKKYKILGRGEIKEKIIISVAEISKSAEDKITKAGGQVILLKKKEKQADNKTEGIVVEKKAKEKKEE